MLAAPVDLQRGGWTEALKLSREFTLRWSVSTKHPSIRVTNCGHDSSIRIPGIFCRRERRINRNGLIRRARDDQGHRELLSDTNDYLDTLYSCAASSQSPNRQLSCRRTLATPFGFRGGSDWHILIATNPGSHRTAPLRGSTTASS